MSQTLAQTELDPERLPRHVAIVMDGNGRWAQAQSKPRTFGHARGAENVLPIVTECSKLGLEALTLFALSSENLVRRPDHEVEVLFDLYERYLIEQRDKLIENNLRFVHVGRRQSLPDRVLREMDRNLEATAGNTGLALVLALNYGARRELADAARSIAQQAAAGVLDPDTVDEQTLADHLYAPHLPDPDLMIRTAGERRVSNFLLWQISYAELYITATLWPDFDVAELHRAFHDFAGRTRRYGAVVK
ncbi:MAG: di-trans,poly-cis-decaprenylcistransferase [Alphaproteobacteria bacterium]|jgi:undecaprenyl diphosphate synthase|nr:di-trans,poly-cis-decaprenylcistransferase [Alphaproteobacteria bacterium]